MNLTKKGALVIAITTLITVIAWVVFDIIHAKENVQIPANTEELIAPLDPTFDTEVLK